MARNSSGTRGDVRKSALWGSGNRGGEFRSNALWGKGGRGTIVLLVMLVLPLLSVAASAKSGSDRSRGHGSDVRRAGPARPCTGTTRTRCSV